MIEGYAWLVLILAAFRLTRLLVYDEITSWVRQPFVETKEEVVDGQSVYYLEPSGKGLRRWMGKLLSCHWCMGVWTTSFLYGGWLLWPGVFIYLAHILALAGAAAIIESLIQVLKD
ncbi:DUF1360 domain-containing protein [Alkalicoccobacillus porphyridii]|uniref:DUF1360 domain-containing protein n=1 Tax=Alkalicoccobacillus porphyridii TaxID=2597270 RepID=A0A553ZXC4_9BACI|nr:DUF1360 domain-containing protein [Alkalicoccobacillus porphyridii]TSB46093.1 DUF1360 domain-containing protein [Alkalicoccobacillus porphyridii]